jgi:N4-(beta-N-acetylglucosaminyl)-L-asparaginase
MEGDAHRGPCVVGSANGLAGCTRAFEMIAQGFDPADAIVQGVRINEDDPEDDTVGLGGLPNEEGVVELDASVMHGPTHKSGAVAGLRGIKNPAMVALRVLRQTDHCLLVGDGALKFALAQGFREENLLTEKARREWLAWRANMSKDDDYLNEDERDAPVGKTYELLPWEDGGTPRLTGAEAEAQRVARERERVWPLRPEVTGTVHLSAVTGAGDVSSCTSTSGLNWKLRGRVGDSPIIGAGNYCDNSVGGAGCTGRGEATIVNLSAYTIVSLMERGMEPTAACLEAAKRVVSRIKERRLKAANGLPGFNVRFYALRKDGAYGSASIFGPEEFAVHDTKGARRLRCGYLYERR